MKSILKTVSLFAIVLFISFTIIGCGCDSKDPITGIYNPSVDPSIPPDGDPTVADNVKNAVNIPYEYPQYQIVSLHFESYILHSYNTDAMIPIRGNNKAYSFAIGIKDMENNRIGYVTISSSQWTLVSDNPEVSKQNDRLAVSASFYSNKDASISLSVNYKGLVQTFTFTLRTNVDPPPITKDFLQGTWKATHQTIIYTYTFSGGNYELSASAGRCEKGTYTVSNGAMLYQTTQIKNNDASPWEDHREIGSFPCAVVSDNKFSKTISGSPAITITFTKQ